MDKKTATTPVTVTGEIEFKPQEMSLIWKVFSIKTEERTQFGEIPVFVPEKGDEITLYEIYKDLKKHLNTETDLFEEGKITFGTEQKAYIIKRLNEFPLGMHQLDTKFSLIEKLK